MLKRKRIREKGKTKFTTYFQIFQPGDRVALVRELNVISNFPRRMQGRTGNVIEKRGAAYVVEVNDLGLSKQFMVKPVHLKKLLHGEQ